MNPSPSVARRPIVILIAIAVLVSIVPTALGQVTQEELATAEAEEAAAAARLSEARERLGEATRLQERIAATLASVQSRQAEAGVNAADEAAAVRGRLTRMYMVAGRPDVLLSTVEDVGTFLTRLAYLGAIAERDHRAVNDFALFITDLTALRDQAERELEALAAELIALELIAATRNAEFEGAATRVAELRSQWVTQEAARRAALQAETRRQEEELASQVASTTTTSTAAGSTTTTVPGGFSTDDGGHVYDPGGGVEQWRPLLTAVFARWGLDEEKCGPTGCLGPHIDDALTIMWCESRGVPFAVNPSSGTTGLYQHRPIFWADRVRRVRGHSESAGLLPSDATPYNPAHNVEVAALLIWESCETLLGNLTLTGPWDDGPEPFGHWDGTSRYCADPPLVWP